MRQAKRSLWCVHESSLRPVMKARMQRKVPTLEWRDGDLPFSAEFEDHYYSTSDGLAETRHVFLDGNDLSERWRENAAFAVGELGFGTGLNLLALWHLWCRNRLEGQTLSFISVEAHLMTQEHAAKALARWPELAPLAKSLLDAWPDLGSKTIDLDPQTRLTVIRDDVFEALDTFPANINAWFLDGFAPSRNGAMWSGEVMEKLAAHSAPGATFASYTSAGWVRRNLEAAGFKVEKKPGFGTKRDMIVGRLQNQRNGPAE